MGAVGDRGQARAHEILEVVLGVPVTRLDDGTTQGSVDLGWSLDGQHVACEVKQVSFEHRMSAR